MAEWYERECFAGDWASGGNDGVGERWHRLRHVDCACARRDSQLPPKQHHRSDGTVILCL